MPIVKVCGITRPGDGRDAVAAGADWLGLNFWPKSKRFLRDRGLARDIVAAARDEAGSQSVRVVGVFVNQAVAEVVDIAEDVGLDMVQPHGGEDEAMMVDLVAAGVVVLPCIALGSSADVARAVECAGDICLVDTPTAGYGGSGRTFDWKLAKAVMRAGKRIVLAGGLNPDNVAEAVAEVKPYGVDVARGVESAPGIKDRSAMRWFVERAKGGGGAWI